nr:hypothetical protein [Tanacetum cinerariifolium]
FAYIPFQRFEAAAFENNFLRGRVDDLSSEVDDMSAKIEHMVPRSELELEKRRVKGPSLGGVPRVDPLTLASI